jgi:hypothetical protein
MDMATKEKIAVLVLVLLVAASFAATHLWSYTVCFFEHALALGLFPVAPIAKLLALFCNIGF